MSKNSNSTQPLTLKQKFLLVVVVPLFFLGIFELGAWGLLSLGVGAPKNDQPTQLEMPTWMLQDANALARRKPNAETLDWLTMFTPGKGFRVHLVPNTSRSVHNTFSLITADRDRLYTIQTNSLGFRGPELTIPKDLSTFRIAVFGDSSSFGWGVNYEDSWAALLQRSLQEKSSKKIEVVNFAIPGDSSAYGTLLFNTYAPKAHADLFILGFGANDAKPVLVSHTQQVSRFKGNSSLLSIAGVLKYSAVFRLIESVVTEAKKRSQAERAKKKERVPAVTPPAYTENLVTMARTAAELGAKNSLLLTLCTPSNYIKRARGVARKNDLLWYNGQGHLIRALPDIVSGKLYPDYVAKMRATYPKALTRNKMFYITSDGCHPNELGHRFVADELTKVITPVLK